MQALLGKRINDKKEIKIGNELWFDNDVYVLVHHIKNRWTFESMAGIYVLNDTFMQEKIEEGIFEVKATR